MIMWPNVFYKRADGTEGNDITVTSTEDTKARYVCYRINENGVVATSEGVSLEDTCCHTLILPEGVLVNELLLMMLVLDNSELGVWSEDWIQQHY